MSHNTLRNQNSTDCTDTQTQPERPTQALARISTILSNERRQHIIRRIAEDGPQTKRELAQALYRIEEGACPDDDPTHDEYEVYYTAVHQSHLPRLEWADVVEERDRRFHPAENFDTVLSVLNGGLLSMGFGDELVGDVDLPGDGGEDDD